MIFAGLDMGARSIKAVLLERGAVLGHGSQLAGFDAVAAAHAALDQALDQARLQHSSIASIFSTGVGRAEAPGIKKALTEVSCAARGARHHFPAARLIIDVGAEESRVIRCNEQGKVVDFAVNEKCAAGSGAFTEALARALEVPLDRLGPLALRSTKTIPISAQCVVFAESEVVSLIHHNVAREDIARAVHDSMAQRIMSLIRRVGFTAPVVAAGGLANNVGFLDSLKRSLQIETLFVPEGPQFCNALGAALAAAGQGGA